MTIRRTSAKLEQSDPLSALFIRIAFLATYGPAKPGFADFRDKYVVSKQSIKDWLGDANCVLIIDEMNQAQALQEKGHDAAIAFFEFLQDNFLSPANRALVFSTHVLAMTLSCTRYLGGSLLEQLPLIVDVEKANKLVAGMTVQQVLYYNKIPALIHTKKWAIPVFDDLEAHLKKSPPNLESVQSLLASFITGSIVEYGFQTFFDTTTTPEGKTLVIWIMCHMHRILNILMGLFSRTNPDLSDQLSCLHDLVSEFRAYQTGSGDEFEKLFAFTLLLRSFCGLACAPFFDVRPRSFSYNKFCKSNFGKCLEYSELKAVITPPMETKFPHVAYYAPTQSSFEKYDAFAFLYATETTKDAQVLGFQLKEGRATPKSDADKAEVPASFLVRGNASGTSGKIKGWRFVSEPEATSFFGLTGAMWIPSELKKLSDDLDSLSAKKRVRESESSERAGKKSRTPHEG